MLADNSRQAGEWIHEQGLRRWPTIVLELQFGLFGHRQRQTEGFDTLGCAIPGNPLKMRPWRSQTGGDSNKACRQPLALVTLVAFTLTVLRESYTHDRASWKGRCVDWSPNSMSNGMVGSFSDELGLTRTQRLGLKYVSDFKERIPRAEAVRIVDAVSAAADRAYGINKVEITPCGSMRRGAQTMSDVDIVLAPREGCVLAEGLKPLLAELQAAGQLKELEELGGHAPNSPWEDGEETFLGVFRLTEEGALHRRVDLILCQRAHRPLEDVFEMLGLPYRPPPERELDDSLMRFVQASRPGGPALKRQKSESTSSQAASAAASASQLLCLEISEDEG
eukprot:s3832_g3.t1